MSLWERVLLSFSVHALPTQTAAEASVRCRCPLQTVVWGMNGKQIICKGPVLACSVSCTDTVSTDSGKTAETSANQIARRIFEPSTSGMQVPSAAAVLSRRISHCLRLVCSSFTEICLQQKGHSWGPDALAEPSLHVAQYTYACCHVPPFHPEDGGDNFLRNVKWRFCQTTRR
jgi:hypothetical protein